MVELAFRVSAFIAWKSLQKEVVAEPSLRALAAMARKTKVMTTTVPVIILARVITRTAILRVPMDTKREDTTQCTSEKLTTTGTLF